MCRATFMFLNCTGGFRLNALRSHLIENSITVRYYQFIRFIIIMYLHVWQIEHMVMPDGHPQMPSHSITWSWWSTSSSHMLKSMPSCSQDVFLAIRIVTANYSPRAPPNAWFGMCMWRLHRRLLWGWWSSPHLPRYGGNIVRTWLSWNQWQTFVQSARRTVLLSWGLPIGQRQRKLRSVSNQITKYNSIYLHSRSTTTLSPTSS